MDKNYIIETLGDIWKEVTLRTMNDHIIENTFVLESIKPYPGYHHATPVEQSKNPGMVFLVIRNQILTEDFIRMTQKVKKHYGGKFDGTPAEIHINNTRYDAIRIKDYGDLSSIKEIMAFYKDEGVHYRKHKSIEGQAIIRLTKYMILEQVSEEIYKDSEDANMAYFELPCQLTWKLFEKVTLNLKRNLPDTNWDAALGVIYRKTGIVDVVRVYAESCTREMVDNLRKHYATEIARYI
jgi:hypothetical protein